MHKLVALFSQADLELAIEELAKTGLDAKTEVIDTVADSVNETVGTLSNSVNPSLVLPTPVVSTKSQVDNLTDKLDIDEDEAEFLAHGLQHGASLLVAEVNEEHLGRTLEILRSHQGRLFEK